MGKELYYNYDCERVGKLKKMLSSVVMIEEDWVDHVQTMFGEQGYKRFLAYPKKWVREEYSEELTDAQAWCLMSHIVAQGVPHALRDKDADEKTNPALYVPQKAAGYAADAVGTTLETTGKVVSSVAGAVTAPFKKPNSEDERDENGAPTESPP